MGIGEWILSLTYESHVQRILNRCPANSCQSMQKLRPLNHLFILRTLMSKDNSVVFPQHCLSNGLFLCLSVCSWSLKTLGGDQFSPFHCAIIFEINEHKVLPISPRIKRSLQRSLLLTRWDMERQLTHM